MSSQRGAEKAASGFQSATSKAPARGRVVPAQGLPKSRRLRRRADFRAVYDGGVRFGCRLFTVYALSTGVARPGRVGLTVTRKIGNAVRRNRCKRLLREAVRRNWALLPAGMDLVLLARPGLRGERAGNVEDELARTLRRTLWRERSVPRRG